jgi:hypothetical protein
MDQKQFDAFQSGVQWVADEAALRKRVAEREEKYEAGHLFHRQRVWASGKATAAIRSIVKASGLGTEYTYDYQVVCPSGCCLAGSIVQRAGDDFVRNDYIQPGRTVETVDHCMDAEGNVHLISQRARELAGLSETEASRLFHQDNGSDTILRLAKEVAVNHGYNLEIIE